MRKIKAKRLLPGSKIGIISISAPEASVYKDMLMQGIKYLENMGFETVLGENIHKYRGYMTGTPRDQVKDIHDFFQNSDIDAIICAGGGSSANRVIPLIDYDIIKSNPKIFMGMSNISLYLNSIYIRTGLITFHGPAVVWNFGAENGLTDYTLEYMKKALSPAPIGKIEELSKWEILKDGVAKGELMGGHLRTTQSLIGTEFEPDWEGKILFWEEVFLEPRYVDSILMHFKLAGVFEKINGMIVGKCVECNPDPTFKGYLSIKEIVNEILEEYNFPIFYNVDLGHTDDKITIPIGCEAYIDTEKRDFSIIEQAVV